MREHLATGAGGLVGRAVVSHLRKRGDHVIAIDRIASQTTEGRVIDCDLRDVHRLDAQPAARSMRALKPLSCKLM
jgi:UDP-glucose 4-epimerase/UDP-glucuronate 4-epimerase